MYNVVNPLTPVKPASENIESAAYACIQVSTDQAYADPGELDHTPALRKSAEEISQQHHDKGEKENEEVYIKHPRLYTSIKVREVPEVPAKSSDLLEYLDTQSPLNAGVHSEPMLCGSKWLHKGGVCWCEDRCIPVQLLPDQRQQDDAHSLDGHRVFQW